MKAPLHLRRRAWLAALLLGLLLPLAHAGEDDVDVGRILYEAEKLDRDDNDPEAARARFEEALSQPDVSPQQRARALHGAARCLRRMGKLEDAIGKLAQILDDADIDADRKNRARTYKKQLEAELERARRPKTEEAQLQKVRQEQERRLRERAEKEAQLAKDLFDAGKLDAARRHALQALSKDQKNELALRLLDEIELQQPNRGQLIRMMIDFYQTIQLEEYQALRRALADIHARGKVAQRKGDFKQVDRLFRDAIARIDESGFLGVPGSDPLHEDRLRALNWLRVNRDNARAAGIELPPEPPAPEPSMRRAGRASSFFDDIAEAVTAGGDSDDPLIFYELGTLRPGGRRKRPSVTARMEHGIQAMWQKSELNRARWAERWIKRNIIGAAPTPKPGSVIPGGARERAARERILVRVGEILAVQNRATVHKQIDDLRRAFPTELMPLEIEVFLIAATHPAVVKSCVELGARARPRERGDALQIPLRAAECVQRLKAADPKLLIAELGSATLVLSGPMAARLDFTKMTDQHPMFADVGEPTLTVPRAEDERYGLRLDLFAEAMPGVTEGYKRHAVSVVATATEPSGSHVVPRSGPGTGDWSRYPVLLQQSRSVDRELRLDGALMLIGLRNPFPETRDERPELMVFLSVKPKGSGTPDPQIDDPGTRIVPTSAQSREHHIGPLAQVDDHFVLEEWPQRSTASSPLTAAGLRERRNRYLARELSRWSGLADHEASTEDLPLLVQNGAASGRLLPDAHQRVARAVQELRKHEDELYEIDVRTAVVPTPKVSQWLQVPGVSALNPNLYKVDTNALGPVEGLLDSVQWEGGLFWTKRLLYARPTQQVVHTRLAVQTIVSDHHVRGLADGGARIVPVFDHVEEGLVLEIRPDLERAGGKRLVKVRARAARLESIVTRPHPGVGGQEVKIQDPRWHPTVDHAGAGLLSDTEAFLMPLAIPGHADHQILVRIVVRKRM